MGGVVAADGIARGADGYLPHEGLAAGGAYELAGIVDVLPAGTQTARGHEPRGMAQLTLTQEEKRIILDNVNMRGESTLALGSLSEGSPVPRGARLERFPETVVRQVPKIRDLKYFAAEDRVAITDPQGSKVELMIEARR